MSVTMKRILGLPKVLTFSPRSPHLSRCSCFVGLVSSFTPTVEPPIPLAATQKIHERVVAYDRSDHRESIFDISDKLVEYSMHKLSCNPK